MAEGHRLRRLHMGEARHDGVDMFCRLGMQRLLQRHQRFIGAPARRPHPQPEIRHHLVVARAGGVQPSRHRPDNLGQPRFDIQVNVFQLALVDKSAGAISASICSSPFEDGHGVILGMMPSLPSMRTCAREPARSPPQAACRID